MTSPEYWREWCATFFRMLQDEGIWAVPRSGLVFQRQGNELVLIEAMPYMPEMDGTITPEQLKEQQEDEFRTIRDHFAAASITVRKADEIPAN